MDYIKKSAEGMMKDFMSGNDRNIHSILIVKDKKLVFEEYFLWI